MGSSSGRKRLEERVVRAAEQALADQQYVTAIDVLLGLGWLAPSHLDRWRQGRVEYLERVTNAGLGKISTAMQIFRRWARDRGLKPSETVYVARTRDRRRLRFSVSGDPDIERAYRTHWVAPELSERKRQRVVEQASKPPDLVVIAPLNEWTCTDCGGTGGLLIMEDAGPLCLVCADLDHLVFLPAGDAALTRRARKASALSAVVVRFSRARKRYERQGVLVEEAALEEAERQCLEDADARARRREREAERRATADEAFVEELTTAIRQRYPGCPPERARGIAQHTAVRGSGRIGRTAAGRDLDPEAIDLAVTAAARHRDTGYDALLMAGTDRHDARDIVRAEVAPSTGGGHRLRRRRTRRSPPRRSPHLSAAASPPRVARLPPRRRSWSGDLARPRGLGGDGRRGTETSVGPRGSWDPADRGTGGSPCRTLLPCELRGRGGCRRRRVRSHRWERPPR